jgi:hypothetical protein
MAGLAAQGPLPAGMLRIRLGSQERYVWPVHLPGWLGLGWRVAGAEAPSPGIAAAEPPAPSAAAASELIEQDDAKPASTRSRRGRRRKEETLPVEPADTGASTVGDNSDAGSDAIGPEPSAQEQDGESPAAGGIEPDPDPDSAADPSPDPELALTSLPDDLFDDPLI